MTTALVVDDSAGDRRLLGKLLNSDGDLSVEYAVDGAEALAGIIHKVPRPCRPCGGQVSWEIGGTADTAVAHVNWLVDVPMNNPG
jgi:CheY-like chemotaxis protein